MLVFGGDCIWGKPEQTILNTRFANREFELLLHKIESDEKT